MEIVVAVLFCSMRACIASEGSYIREMCMDGLHNSLFEHLCSEYLCSNIDILTSINEIIFGT